MPYIIDGYNLLCEINKTGDDSERLTDAQMCKMIGKFLSYIGEKGEIIFDGIGPPEKTAFEYIKNLDVFFTGQSTDADSVIEDKISADSAPKRLTIVSSDRRIKKAGSARKTVTVASRVFWEDVLKQLSRKTKVHEPKQKREGLSQGETEQWLKFFDLDK